MFKQRIFRYSPGLFITFILFANASGILPLKFLQTFENIIYDFHQQLSAPAKAPDDVIIITIDEKSQTEIGKWPWPRNILADLVDNLFEYYKIKTLAFNFPFAEKDENSSDQILAQLSSSALSDNADFQRILRSSQDRINRDVHFASSLQQRNTVLAMQFNKQYTELSSGQLTGNLPQLTTDILYNAALPVATAYTANIALLQNSAISAGFIDNPLTDADGVSRRIPLLQAYRGEIYPSLALQISRLSLENNTLKPGFSANHEKSPENSLQWIYVGDKAIGVDNQSAVMVPFYGTKNNFSILSAVDILNKSIPRNLLNEKIIIINTSKTGVAVLHKEPLTSSYPDATVHANIIQGILDQTIRHKPAYMANFEVLLLLSLGIILTFLFPLLSPLWNTSVSLVTLIVILLVDHYAWNQLLLIIPVALPVLLIILLYFVNMSYYFVVRSRVTRQLTDLFSRHVSPAMISEMSDNLKDIKLLGDTRNMSILYASVGNFTEITKTMLPQELTAFMHSFLSPVTRIIHQHRGTLDKYMSDTTMAFWGAPLDDPLHARHALNAGTEILKAIKKLNKELKSQQLPQIKMNIGINTGEMMTANTGSDFRVDYTVLGNTASLASQLTELTSKYAVSFIVSETTRHEAPEFEYLLLDFVRLNTDKKPQNIYQPVGLVENIDKSVRTKIKEFHHALQLYQKQNWDSAEQIIFQLSQQEPERKIYKIYLDRIAFLRNNYPGKNWDGVFTGNSL